tara:strand:- start:849 stop:1004 length:156 start_codon:yes stop_codon:yes gene_type:complete
MGVINTETDQPYNAIEERARDNAMLGILESILLSLQEISNSLKDKEYTNNK